jgi:hypothetical protein
MPRILAIVREQLTEMKKSRLLDSAPVFYNVIGSYNATGEIQQECGDQCHALKYTADADESITLRAIHGFCREQTDDEDTLVTYIHDKGSLHPSPKNTNLRIMLAKSAFSDGCQTIGTGANNTCNVCSARFSPFPHYHVPGNMWTARCSYIRNLIKPDEFASKMESLMDVVFNHTKTASNIPKPTIQQYNLGYNVGCGRFAVEHWVGSHPSIRPCDVYPGNFLWGYGNLPGSTDLWDPDLQRAPRFPLPRFLSGPFAPNKGSWYCGQGRLLEFQYLYGERPTEDSFVWFFYAEPFFSCTEPLEYSKHKSLYVNLSTVIEESG